MQHSVSMGPVEPSVECKNCVTRNFTLYAQLDPKEQARFAGCRLRGKEVKARSGIYWADKPADEIAVLKQGWAFSFKLLSDGRRQILDFYMDGDILAVPLVLTDSLPYGIQTISKCSLCMFNSVTVRNLALSIPNVEMLLWRDCVKERFSGMERLVDLGRRTAMERLCRMLIMLMEKAVARGKGSLLDFEFPLRHHHMADFLGLTSVHTGRLINELTQQRVLRLQNRRLSLLDYHRLRNLAGMP